MEDVRHINRVDTNEQVYCHNVGKIVTFDGPFVAKTCWLCPLWGGLSDGYGVECVWDDAKAPSAEVKYTKPATAQAEAGERPSDLSAIGSQASLAALKARLSLKPGQEDQAEQPASDESMSNEDMQSVMEGVSAKPAGPKHFTCLS